MVFTQLAALSLKASTILSNQLLLTATSRDTHSFNWEKIEPHPSLQWHDCFTAYKCARLQVPMDWHHNTTEADKTVELAVIKLEATVPVTDPTYGGAVFFNPGGPSGSGVRQILTGGHALRTILSAGPEDNAADARNFDVMSFDPRGVNNTRPTMQCFPNHLEADAWQFEKHAEGYIGDTSTSFDNLWARMRALADGCSKRTAKEGIALHMSTAPVARDVLELFERHGEWREAEARGRIEIDTALSLSDREATLQRTAYSKGEEMIQYWGYSYGAVLGAHIAAMYPDRIARLVIDGVAESHDYMAGGWTTNLQDTDMIFLKLAEYCWAGGKKHCPLWHEDGPAAIVDMIQSILSNFQQNPISRAGNDTHGPSKVNYHDYQAMVRDAVYNPLRNFPAVTQIIFELSQGVATTLQADKVTRVPQLGVPLSSACLEDGPYSAACQRNSNWGSDAQYGIECSDGLSRTKQSKEEYREYASMLMNQSSLIGASWAEIQMPCTAWHARPAWRYEGDFVAETAHPILLVGNTYDPVTPLRNAFTMAKGFSGSRVLHLNTEGHCSYASPSMCTGKALREYFQSGVLPKLAQGKDHAFCEPDLLPLHGYGLGSKPKLPKGQSDEALWTAMVDLNQIWP